MNSLRVSVIDGRSMGDLVVIICSVVVCIVASLPVLRLVVCLLTAIFHLIAKVIAKVCSHLIIVSCIIVSLPKFPSHGSRKCKHTNWYLFQRVKKSILRKIREEKKHQDINDNFNNIGSTVYFGLGVSRKKGKMTKKQQLRNDKKLKAAHERTVIRINVARRQMEREQAVATMREHSQHIKEGFSEVKVADNFEKRAILLKNDSWMNNCSKHNLAPKRKTRLKGRHQSLLLPTKCQSIDITPVRTGHAHSGYATVIDSMASCRIPLRYVRVNYMEFWCNFELHKESTIAELKVYIHECVGFHPSSQILKVGKKCLEKMSQLLEEGAEVIVGSVIRGGVKKVAGVGRCSCCFNTVTTKCCELNFCSECLPDHNYFAHGDVAHDADSDDEYFRPVSRKKKRNHSQRISSGKYANVLCFIVNVFFFQI